MLNKKTMSSLEIADFTGKRHDHVMRDIEIMVHELGPNLGTPPTGCFINYYTDHLNRKSKMFELDEDLTMTLVSEYNAKLRDIITKEWRMLKEDTTPKMTQLEVLAMEFSLMRML